MRDSASKSGHSLRLFAEMLLSNPVAFDLHSFDSSAKTCHSFGVVFSKTKFLSVSKDLSAQCQVSTKAWPNFSEKGV